MLGFVCLFKVFQLVALQRMWLAAYVSEEWYAVWGLPLKENVWQFRVKVNKAEIYQHRDKEKQMYRRAALKAEFTSCSLLVYRKLSLLWKYPSGLSSMGRVLWVGLGAHGINHAISTSPWHHDCGTSCSRRIASIAGISVNKACLLITEKQHAMIRNYLPAVSV